MKIPKIIKICFLVLGLGLSVHSQAQVYVGGGGYYGGGYRNYHGHPGYPGYYGGGYGGGWGAPNIIVTVPVIPPQPAYVFECETVEVCDNYTDECWLERRCD